MIRNGTRSDLHAIRELLGHSNESPYDIRAVAEEKVFGDGFSGKPRVRVFEDDSVIRGVAVSCGKFLRLIAVEPMYRRHGFGSALLRDSEATVIAAEAGNYFTPGVVEDDSETIAFFRAKGFGETAATWNLEVNLGERASRPQSPGVSPVDRDSDRARRPITAGETPALLEFIEKNFGKIWAFEASRAAASFYIPDIGFAVVEANNKGLGTFGPTGVVESMRGKGHGKELLLTALADLRRRGYKRAIIPWTDAIDFYRKSCGAEPSHRFLTFTR